MLIKLFVLKAVGVLLAVLGLRLIVADTGVLVLDAAIWSIGWPLAAWGLVIVFRTTLVDGRIRIN